MVLRLFSTLIFGIALVIFLFQAFYVVPKVDFHFVEVSSGKVPVRRSASIPIEAIPAIAEPSSEPTPEPQSESQKHATAIKQQKNLTKAQITTSFVFVKETNLLWCPTAKSGTTLIYGILSNHFRVSHERCNRYWKCDRSLLDLNKHITDYYTQRDCLRKKRCGIEDESFWDDRRNFSNIVSEAEKRISFTVVRNPWDRLFSAYYNKIRHRKIDFIVVNGTTMWLKRKAVPTFEQFVEYVAMQLPREMNMHWGSYEYRCHTSGPNAYPFDFILRAENGLKSGIQKIAAYSGVKLRLDYDTKFEHREENKRYRYFAAKQYAYRNKLVNTNLVKLVGQIYKGDVTKFNYVFSDLEESIDITHRNITPHMRLVDDELLWCAVGSPDEEFVYEVLQDYFACIKGLRQNVSKDGQCLEFHEFLLPKEAKKISQIDDVELFNVRRRISFTLVRNPWDRIISIFESKIRTEEIPTIIVGNKHISTSNLTFAKFVRYIGTQNPNEMDPLWQPYSHLCHTEGINKFPYDVTIRLEDDVVSGLQAVYNEALIPGDQLENYVKTEANSDKLLANRYFMFAETETQKLHRDSELIDIVQRVYAQDISRFNYSFRGDPFRREIKEDMLTRQMRNIGENLLSCDVLGDDTNYILEALRMPKWAKLPVESTCRTNSLNTSCLNLMKRTAFLTVRNPWFRIYYVYKNFVRTGEVSFTVVNRKNVTLVKEGVPITFQDFLEVIAQQEIHEMNHVWKPFHSLCHTSGAKAFPYDVVLSHENLENDLSLLESEGLSVKAEKVSE